LSGLAAAAIELGLVDELRIFRYPVVVGGSRVIYERYGRVRDESE
jgi:riboflavin biosynthesis pyrimidine reductase